MRRKYCVFRSSVLDASIITYFAWRDIFVLTLNFWTYSPGVLAVTKDALVLLRTAAPSDGCFLSTLYICIYITLHSVERFEWNLLWIFIMWVGTAEMFQGQRSVIKVVTRPINLYWRRHAFWQCGVDAQLIFTALHVMQTRYSEENSVCLSVRLSVTRVIPDKTEERSVQIFIPYERTFILVFWEEEWLVGGDPFYRPRAKSPIFNQ